MKTILITGGLGFIGSHTCINLAENGNNIVIIDSLINSNKGVLKNIRKILALKKIAVNVTFEKGDIRDKLWLNNIFSNFKKENRPIYAVIHFAGLKSVAESTQKPLSYWDANVYSTICLLEIMRLHNCKNLVFSSSATIYKPVFNQKLKEDSLIGPISPYGQTKKVIEDILSDLFIYEPNEWKIVSLRYFNPIGAHNSGLLGENPLTNATNLFPIILKVLAKKIDYLSVFGKDYQTIDGTCIRDYIHIMDLADAHVAALNFLIKNKHQYHKLNIGTGIGTSVLEIIKEFSKISKVDIPYKFKDRREGDTAFLVADNKKALKLLDWEPLLKIEDMCRDSWKWALKNKTL